MSRNQVSWFAAMALLTLAAAATAPAFPMIEETKSGTPETAGTEAEAADGDGDRSTVESILRAQEQMRQGRRFSYDPEGRRDPFRSLFDGPEKGPNKKKCEGILCMGVDDIDLAGIVKDATGGDLAYVTGSDNKGYFLRVGDRVWDGHILAIDSRTGAVTFRQKVDDPRSIKDYRDVVRRLASEESANE